MVLLCPASVNGIVGIKPTVGLVESIWNYSIQNSKPQQDQWRELVQMLHVGGNWLMNLIL
jgi:hypothetical protein